MSVNRITLTGTVFGQICQNVWHFNIPDQTTGSLPTLLVALRDHWMDRWKNLSIGNVTFISLRGEVLQSGGVGQVEVLLINIFGGGTNEVQTFLGNSMVVQFRTGIAGRRNRGRSYVIGTANAYSNQGVYTGSSFNSICVAAVNALQADWITNHLYTGSLCIHGPNDDPSDYRIVTTMSIRTTPGSQRRRLVGVGA